MFQLCYLSDSITFYEINQGKKFRFPDTVLNEILFDSCSYKITFTFQYANLSDKVFVSFFDRIDIQSYKIEIVRQTPVELY